MPEVRIDDTPNGRVVTLVSHQARVTVHEHGAHVTSWIPADGEEGLFLSSRARIDGRTAIRGGVPVIFPQFGPGPLPKHGFARTARWTLAEHGIDGEGEPYALLALADDATTRATWPHGFALSLEVRLDDPGDALAMTLQVENTGDAPFDFTGALHTYLRVADVTRASVRGLAGRRVRDQLTGTTSTEGDAAVRVGGPVDRVYVDVPGPLAVRDDARGRTIDVSTRGFRDVVLWNPWVEGARAFDDMADDEWRHMLCVEAAVVATPVTLAPGTLWAGEQRLELARDAG